jgi:hypothetical protein
MQAIEWRSEPHKGLLPLDSQLMEDLRQPTYFWIYSAALKHLYTPGNVLIQGAYWLTESQLRVAYGIAWRRVNQFSVINTSDVCIWSGSDIIML